MSDIEEKVRRILSDVAKLKSDMDEVCSRLDMLYKAWRDNLRGEMDCKKIETTALCDMQERLRCLEQKVYPGLTATLAQTHKITGFNEDVLKSIPLDRRPPEKQ